MNKRMIATILFALIGVLEMGDFVANLTIFTSESASQVAADVLGGITLQQEAQRLLVLVILTGAIAFLCLTTAWGYYRNSRWLRALYRWAALALAAYAIFHFITALTLPAASFAWFAGVAYGLVAALAYVTGQRALS